MLTNFSDSIQSALTLTPDCKKVIIAYSGGVDSHVLMHVCSGLQQVRSSLTFEAVYIDHGLHKDSDKWRIHCERVANKLSIDFNFIKVDARDVNGEGPEQAARHARYGAFKHIVGEHSVLFTAQHQDDQAETVLLQLFRGCGIDGLAAMPLVDAFSRGHIVRPFLDIDRVAIQAYAALHELEWVEDPSNAELNYSRNYLRQVVIPNIKQRWPAFSKTISRTARHCAEASDLLSSQLSEYIDEQRVDILDLNNFLDLDRSKKRAIYRYWLRCNGVKMPSSNIIQALEKNAVEAAIDKMPVLRWAGHEIRRFENSLYLLDGLPNKPEGYLACWDEATCTLPVGLGSLSLNPTNDGSIAKSLWLSGEITVKYRDGGETIKIAGRQGTKALKKLFNERRVPPWVRERVPLIYINGRLAAVGEYWIEAAFLAKDNEAAYQIKWQHPEFRID
ncbi:MAG: tRNA lysidine(34) synthetase TilS [Piscirickettsiaceae bacterium]|nr:MAG: tRNA lysidine(34) synthetase TilS [Piscirickettsiaceae bacterium]